MIALNPAKRRPQLRGFSLIELVMVLAITAIIAAIAMPRYGNALMRFRAQAAAERIVADMRLAQQRARQVSASQTVVFNTSNGTYGVAGMADIRQPANNYTVSISGEPYRASISSVNFAGIATLEFNGYGEPKSGGTVTVQAGSATRSIVVDATTGLGTIQ